MNETYVTLQGWVGGRRGPARRGGHPVRVVPGRVDAALQLRNGSWVDGQTSWYTVNCWRGLGKNVGDSIRRGDAVVVHGRVRVDVWEREGQPASVTWVVDATFVGHDLTKGTSSFAKTARATPRDPRENEVVREVLHAYERGRPAARLGRRPGDAGRPDVPEPPRPESVGDGFGP